MPENIYINLQGTEQAITVAAAHIYAAFIANGQASDPTAAREKAVLEAIEIARMVDDKVITSGEMA